MQGMKLQELEERKDTKDIGNLIRKNPKMNTD